MLKTSGSKKKALISLNDTQRIDHSNSAVFTGLVGEQINSGRDIYINLNKVFFIDSEGFKSLMNIQKKVEKAGGELKLIELSAALTDLFNLMGLTDKFQWASSDMLKDPVFSS